MAVTASMEPWKKFSNQCELHASVQWDFQIPKLNCINLRKMFFKTGKSQELSGNCRLHLHRLIVTGGQHAKQNKYFFSLTKWGIGEN